MGWNTIRHESRTAQNFISSDVLPSMGSVGSKSIAAKAPRRRLDCLRVTCIVKMGPDHDDDGENDELEMTMMRMRMIVFLRLTGRV